MCASFQSVYSATCCTHYVYFKDSLGSQVWCSSFSLEYLRYFLGTLVSLFVSNGCLFTTSATKAIPKSKQ